MKEGDTAVTTTAAQDGAEACVRQWGLWRVMRGLVEAGKAMCEYQGGWPHNSLLPRKLRSAHQALCGEGGGEGGGGQEGRGGNACGR